MTEDFCPYCGTEMVAHVIGDDETVMCQGCGYSPDTGGPEGEPYEEMGGEG
jgi:DNA-directed RNA polymerase subunit M/transcription elongation factor TFIIS